MPTTDTTVKSIDSMNKNGIWLQNNKISENMKQKHI